MLSRRASAVVIVALVLIALLAGALPVFAASATALPMHARLLSSSPADGAEVEAAEEVVLAFNEEVDPTFVKVTVEGPGGDEAQGEPEVDGREVTQALADDLGAGEHVVTYRVVSADGHPISGKVTFTSTAAPSPSPSASASTSATATPSPSASATPEPAPSVDAEPAADEGGPSGWVWVLLGAVVLVGLLALATQWRVLGGPAADERADAEADGRSAESGAGRRDDPFA